MRPYRSGICWHALLLLVSAASAVRAQDQAPPDLPRYDLQIVLDVAQHSVKTHEVVVWTNRTKVATKHIVFNAHAHYSIPSKDVGTLAKMVEILRMAPKESLYFDGPPMTVEAVRYHPRPESLADPPPAAQPLTFHFPEDQPTTLVVPLAEEVKPGESVTLELDFTIKLPARKGRWGQWDGITTLAQWLPVVAIFDESKGWQSPPFIPWHQPYFNDAGHYTVQVTLPKDHKLAASAAVENERELTDGWKVVRFVPVCVRDFALIASARFQEWTDEVDGITIRCVARPEHEFYARLFVETAREAIPVYSRWFGKYPYKQFTIAESCFGWNGNECGALVMIDDRMFDMPHIAKYYPTYLLQHEICHQWWYNIIGTNGYAETWMDEGMATYFGHRLADRTHGRNNALIEYPRGLGWLPNIRRDDLRNYCMVGTWARGEGKPCVPQDGKGLPEFGHLINLTSSAYDRGSKVVGMIEERLGEENFFAFMKQIYRKYQYRILRVTDFQRELETFTGRSWDEFFRHWVYTSGMCDWAIDHVEVGEYQPPWDRIPILSTVEDRIGILSHDRNQSKPVRVVVHLRQQGEFNEPTTLGIRLQAGSEYQIRVPIYPDVPVLNLEAGKTLITCAMEEKNGKPSARAKVEIVLPMEPLQISVDPDQLLPDVRPTNNHWKQEIRWNWAPLTTQLDEVDVTNAYDRWNFTAGPWVYKSSYTNPWFTKSELAGFRAGVYRMQELDAGAYAAYRTSDRNLVAGADVLWDHVGLPNVQIGFSFEQVIAQLSNEELANTRGVLFARYVLMYGSSLYLPPFEYIEGFGMMQDNGLPVPGPNTQQSAVNPVRERPSLGLHYHKNLMTPYWDAEGGYSFDLTYQYGLPIFGNSSSFHELYGQVALVKGMPKILDAFGDGPVVRWLYDTRFAFRVGGAAGLPSQGLLFPLGGGDQFRGFDLSERQGNMLWLASVEWRLPLATHLPWHFCDHIVHINNIYLAPFYDVGNAYVNGQELGPNAHAVGAGLRVDVTWLGLIERTMLRFDVAKTVNSSAPWQIWFGIQHPF